MNVLVAVASKHGGTEGIAREIARGLEEHGIAAEVRHWGRGAKPAHHHIHTGRGS
ncbi:MAG TPA: hypothetical protein VJ259_04355 [Actinomycetota bacterium]|jgi:menaquinone-dependent protoporphyrinogen IX oxidase|nr:hypothetical protein [Actinomycetota bacterium]